MEEKINDLIKSVNDIKVIQNKIISMVKSQSDKLTELTTIVDYVTLRTLAVNESLKSKVACVKDKIT